MPYWNISMINGTVPDTTYVGVASAVPWLFPALLFFEFMLIFLSGNVVQKNRIGFSNVSMWGAISGLVTTTTAFLWSVVQATILGTNMTLISLWTIGSFLAVTVLFAFWFLMSDLD